MNLQRAKKQFSLFTGGSHIHKYEISSIFAAETSTQNRSADIWG